MDTIRETSSTSASCSCDVDIMSPEARSSRHICLRCSKTITPGSMNAYNRHFGFSGYDEHPDLD